MKLRRGVRDAYGCCVAVTKDAEVGVSMGRIGGHEQETANADKEPGRDIAAP